jgi:hypothetical protein
MEGELKNVPVRSYMDDPNIKWRHGKPDYTVVNTKFLKEKSQNHKTGSIEKLVEGAYMTMEIPTSSKHRTSR